MEVNTFNFYLSGKNVKLSDDKNLFCLVGVPSLSPRTKIRAIGTHATNRILRTRCDAMQRVQTQMNKHTSRRNQEHFILCSE